MSNNFDTPVLLDDINNYFGFGRQLPFGDESTGPRLMVRDLDPRAGLGVAAPLGSFLLRNTSGSVSGFQKTSAPDTGWTLVFGTGAGGGFTFVYVLDPGGVAGGNVYTDFASLYAAAFAAGSGAKLCIIRDNAQVPANEYDFENWQFEGAQDGRPTLTFQTGVVIRPGTFPKSFKNLSITWLNPFAVSYQAVSSFMCVFQNVTLNPLSAQAVVTCGADTRFVIVATDDTTINRGVGPFVETLDSTAVVQILIDGGSNVAANIVVGVGDVEFYPQGQAGLTQQGGSNVTFEWPDREWLEDAIQSISIDDTLQFDVSMVLVNTSGGPVNVTGDPISGYGGARRFTLQKVSPGNDPLIFTCDAGDTVNGAASVQTTTAYGRIELVNDGANAWYAAIY